MHSIVVSLGNIEDGHAQYLRMVGDGEELTLPVIKAKPEHRNFILGTWVKSYVNTVRKITVGCTKGIAHTEDVETYLRNEPKVAERLWETSHVVTAPDDEFVIHAWVCGEEGKLWHVYVPPQLRNKGIARALIEYACGTTYDVARPWPFKRGLPGQYCYNPYMLGEALNGR